MANLENPDTSHRLSTLGSSLTSEPGERQHPQLPRRQPPRGAVRRALRPQIGFRLPSFRGAQGEIIGHVAAGGDALVLMPTAGQVAVLPDPGAAARGLRHRDLAADRAHARPGRLAARAACVRFSQLHARCGLAAKVERNCCPARSTCSTCAGAAGHAVFLDLLDRARWRCSRSTRRMRVAVGPRFPAGVHRTRPAGGRYPVSRASPDGHRRSTRARTSSRAWRCSGAGFVASFDRPNIATRSSKAEPARASARVSSARATRGVRIVYCCRAPR